MVVGEQIAHRARTGAYHDMTIMMPIVDVFKDIEEVTQGKMILPDEQSRWAGFEGEGNSYWSRRPFLAV